ncbi:MAG: lysophospholipid acyltransferase family protein [Verrucomicrobiales bacterium]|nr:lysophospholipid acyltransferase family protein [Verrucomicrobiales bacterium]
MLEFSDANYQFFEPKPSRPIIALSRAANRHLVLPGKNHLIKDIQIEGDTRRVRDLKKTGHRILFVMNHPSHSDPQIVTELHRRMRMPSSFMAAYDVFLRSKRAAWCMQRLGHFSIDREGNDRKAMATAINILKEGKFALNIFPEGNVYLTNDRVTPFLDGTAFIALKAQKALENERVTVVPLSLKFTHLTTPRATLRSRMRTLGDDSGFTFDPDPDPVEAIMGLGTHLLAAHLRTHGYGNEISPTDRNVHRELDLLAHTIMADIEKELNLPPSVSDELISRIRKARSTIHSLRIKEDSDIESNTDLLRSTAQKTILALRIHGYLDPYLTANPTIDRFDETVEKLSEDFYSKAMPRTGPRRLIAKVHPPLDVSQYLSAADGKLKDAVSTLTRDMENRVQSGIDAINERNDAPGATPLEEVS